MTDEETVNPQLRAVRELGTRLQEYGFSPLEEIQVASFTLTTLLKHYSSDREEAQALLDAVVQATTESFDSYWPEGGRKKVLTLKGFSTTGVAPEADNVSMLGSEVEIGADGQLDLSTVGAPVNVSTGQRMAPEDASGLIAALASGEIKIEIPPEVARQMQEAGIDSAQMPELLIAAARKTLS